MIARRPLGIPAFLLASGALLLPLAMARAEGLAPALAVRADVIHLRTGQAVKGRPIQERSNEEQLTVEDYVTGALRRFAWSAVDPADRDYIQELWNWKNTDQGIVQGHRVVVQLAGGDTDEVLGLVEGQDDRVVRLRRGGDLLEIPRASVLSIEEEPLDARQVWSPEQIVQRLLDVMRDQPGVDLANLTARDHWRIATQAEWAGALELAREHYAACAADAEYLQKDVAEQRLQRVESLLQDRAALETLKDARMKLQLNFFKRVKEILDTFGEKHPEASEAIRERVERVRAELVAERASYFQTVAARNFVKIVEDLIEDKVRQKGVQLNDVQSWTRRELVDQAFEALAEKHMKRYDEDVTAEEARTFWEGRMGGRFKPRWERVTYGSGTFIVDPPKVKPPQRRQGGGNRPGGGAAPPIQIPKPPTRDQWWEQANARERTQWVLAFFIERSELFELGEREYRPCAMCHGVGLLSKTFQTGDVLSYLCTRCGGAQSDVIVKYR